MNHKNSRHETGNRIAFYQHHNNTTTPDLVDDRTRRALKEVPPGRCRRVVGYLLTHGPSTTAELAGHCACGNVSDAFIRALPGLHKHGVTVAHEHPEGLQNRFGELSMMHLWWLDLVEPVEVSQ